MEIYGLDDIEIVDVPTGLILGSEKKSDPVIFPYHDEDGKKHYMSEDAFSKKISEDYQSVTNMFKDAKKLLNQLKSVRFPSEILYLEPVNKEGIITDYEDESIRSKDGIIIDYDYVQEKKIEKAQRKLMKSIEKSNQNREKKMSLVVDYDYESAKRYVKTQKGYEKEEKRILRKVEKNNKHRKIKMPLKALRKAACLATVIFGLSFVSSSSAGGDINNQEIASSTYENDDTKMNTSSQVKTQNGINTTQVKDKQNETKYSKYIQLKNAKLSYTSTGKGPSASTTKLDCDSYRPTRVAILNDDNTIIDVFDIPKNERINIQKMKKQIKSVYGASVNIQINVDGIKDNKIIHKQAGWISINKVKSLKLKKSEKHI